MRCKSDIGDRLRIDSRERVTKVVRKTELGGAVETFRTDMKRLTVAGLTSNFEGHPELQR